MASPTSQKADQRPISFRLDDGQGAVTTVPLVIRPEELTHPEPAMQNPVKTLGGAFLDDFGADLSMIMIAGHTGWGGGNRPDGIAEFKKLHDVAWNGWHSARARAIAAGRDVGTVKLIFIDELNEITVVVAPGNFTLRRHKQRPLLMMYSISMTVLGDDIAPPLSDPLDFSSGGSFSTVQLGLSSLQSSVDSLTSAAGDIRSFVSSSLAAPLGGIVGQATSAFGKVISVVNDARGVITDDAAQYVNMATDLAQVGFNAFSTYNAVADPSDFTAHDIASVSAAFGNAFCVLQNAFTKAPDYPDYDGIFGASNCSSTVGGSPLSPLADQNPWESILPAPSAVASITPDARSNIDIFKQADPVLRPMSLDELATRAIAVTSGVSFPWL